MFLVSYIYQALERLQTWLLTLAAGHAPHTFQALGRLQTWLLTLTTAYAPYTYQALGELQIRLLTLAAGKESDEIHIRLYHVDLRTNPGVHYEALSYAWGTSRPTQRVLVDTDNGPSQFLPVRDNLADALRRIRDTTANKTLWIDALCLNQEDNIEKGHQIPFMPLIYRNADRVIIWLGPERDHSSTVMDLLRIIGRGIRTDSTTNIEEPHEVFHPIFRTLANDTSLQALILRLFERDWFERLWVLQEVYLSRRAVVFCGSYEVDWTTFARGASWLIPNDTPHWDVMFFLTHLHKVGWGNLRAIVPGKKCVDTRDKIYGALSLVEDNDIQPLKVDYSLSVPEVFTAAAKHHFQTHQHFCLFASCEWTPSMMDNLPSWVPDWSTDLTCPAILAPALSTGTTHAFVDFPGTGTMRLAGVMSSRVQSVEPLGRTPIEAIKAMVRFTRTIRTREKQANTNGPFGEALFCFLTGNKCHHSGFLQNSPHPIGEDCRSAESCIVSLATGMDSDSVAKAALQQIHNFLQRSNWRDAPWVGRALFLTEEGHIGLGLSAAVDGDRLFFPLGSEFPVLIRSNGGESQRNEWLLIGNCYVDGFMAGEILYGPLPSNLCLMRGELPSKGIVAFHRRGSNHEVNNEPEFGVEQEMMRKAFGVEEGELLTPNLLKSKGVPVEWIDLV